MGTTSHTPDFICPQALAKLLPITEIHVETTVFDPQLLREPEIHGVEYQQGPLYRTNLRAAVLQRDGRKCVYCGHSGKRQPLELDHMVPKSHGGTDRYDNLVAACRTCNSRVPGGGVKASV